MRYLIYECYSLSQYINNPEEIYELAYLEIVVVEGFSNKKYHRPKYNRQNSYHIITCLMAIEGNYTDAFKTLYTSYPELRDQGQVVTPSLSIHKNAIATYIAHNCVQDIKYMYKVKKSKSNYAEKRLTV